MRKALTIASVIALLALTAGAKDKHKDYPLNGTVASFHAQQEVRGSGSTDYQGKYESSVGTYERRVYVVKTSNGTIEVTGWENGFKARKRPPLTVGQEIKYRTDGKYIYTILDDEKEHRFYLMGASQE